MVALHFGGFTEAAGDDKRPPNPHSTYPRNGVLGGARRPLHSLLRQTLNTVTVYRGGAEAARRAHNPEVTRSRRVSGILHFAPLQKRVGTTYVPQTPTAPPPRNGVLRALVAPRVFSGRL